MKLTRALAKVKETNSPIQLIQDGMLYILVMNRNDNRFTDELINGAHAALDTIDKDNDLCGKVMVTMTTHPKIFCNGMELSSNQSEKEIEDVLNGFNQFCYRLVSSKIPTVACVNGHAFAGGWFLSIAHHYRIMNCDRGWACLNALTIKIPIPACLSVMAAEKIGTSRYQDAATAHRMNAQQAFEYGFCHKFYNSNEIISKTEEFAENLGAKRLDPIAFQIMNKDIYRKSLLSLGNERVQKSTIHRIINIKPKE